MFRKYKESGGHGNTRVNRTELPNKDAQSKSTKAGYAETKTPTTYSEESFIPSVIESWKQIEHQCTSPKIFSPVTRSKGEWKTIRFFVSSTFTDFHNEREVLVKKMIPALRDWCEERYLRLIECDLRWGVPKDSTSAATISTCLEEIEQCHIENDNRPFFINMLSERYGWVPTEAEVPFDIANKFHWVPEVSITHMEILVGAYRDKNPNSLFLIRNRDVMDNIPKNHIGKFVDEDIRSQQQLAVLKQKLRERFSNQVVDYSAYFVEVDESEGHEKVIFDGLSEMSEVALEFFKKVIEQQYPLEVSVTKSTGEQTEEDPNASEVTEAQENEVHSKMMEKKSQFVFGRDQEIAALVDYIQGASNPMITEAEVPADEEEEYIAEAMKLFTCSEDPNRNLILSGISGIGKSALLAAAATRLKKMGYLVHYHNVGVSSESYVSEEVLRRIVKFMQEHLRAYPDPEDATATVKVVDKLSGLMKKLRWLGSNFDKTFVIIIDGLNMMSDSDGAKRLAWLPPRWPSACRAIMSTESTHNLTVNSLKPFRPVYLVLDILSIEARSTIVNSFFDQYHKRLDDDQLQMLVSHRGGEFPLWLSISCEELRVYGDFRTLTKKISLLPDTLEGLLQNVLARLIDEDDTKCMVKMLLLMYCSQEGLPQAEMSQMLGDVKNKVTATMMTVATLYRQLRPFTLLASGSYGNRLTFSHNAVKEAVKVLLSIDDAKQLEGHTLLADFYQYYCKDQFYTQKDLPHHLLEAGLKSRLADFYRTDPRSIGHSFFYRQQNMNKIRCPYMHPMGLNDPALSVKLCRICGSKMRIFSPMMQAKDACAVCGMFISPSMSFPARLCMQHRPLGALPNMDKCMSCTQYIGGALGPAIPAQLCHMCKNTMRCCKIII